MQEFDKSTQRMRVVVTGVGIISALGASVESTWEGLENFRSGLTPLGEDSTHSGTSIHVGRVPKMVGPRIASAKRRRRLDYCHLLAIAAGEEALESARFTKLPPVADCGIFVGTSLGGMLSGVAYDRARVAGLDRPLDALELYPFHVLLDRMTDHFRFEGARNISTSACTASTHAIAEAFDAVAYGEVAMTLAGGVDPFCDFALHGFLAMKNVADGPCTPFSKREGLSIGEGAAFLVLEPMSAAMDRGANILAEVCGYSAGADGYHPTAPDPTGTSHGRLISNALDDAGITVDDVDWIKAHGTGTFANDRVETKAIHLAFRGASTLPPVSSLKGALGHALGAAGAIETAAGVLAIAHQTLPGTVGFTEARSGCNLDYIAEGSRAATVEYAISQNFAFGGNNCAIVLGRPRKGSATRKVPSRDVVITGLGIVSPLGISYPDFASALGKSFDGFSRHHQAASSEIGWNLAAMIDDEALDRASSGSGRRMDRLSRFVLVAAEDALATAGLRSSPANAQRIGLSIGTMGPTGSCLAFHREIAMGRPELADPKHFPFTVFNACAGVAASQLRLKGPNVVTTLGQASGISAILRGATFIRTGRADAMICGGADELSAAVIEGYGLAGVLSQRCRTGARDDAAIRPFCATRDGLALGEGAAFVMLESRAAAEERGARVLATVEGGTTGTMGSRKPERANNAAHHMWRALRAAGRQPEDVDYVAAGAMGLDPTDAAERSALEQVFVGDGPNVAALSSRVGVSAMTGSLSVCATITGMNEGFLPAGSGTRRPEIKLPLLKNGPISGTMSLAMVNGISLGGSLATILIGSA